MEEEEEEEEEEGRNPSLPPTTRLVSHLLSTVLSISASSYQQVSAISVPSVCLSHIPPLPSPHYKHYNLLAGLSCSTMYYFLPHFLLTLWQCLCLCPLSLIVFLTKESLLILWNNYTTSFSLLSPGRLLPIVRTDQDLSGLDVRRSVRGREEEGS